MKNIAFDLFRYQIIPINRDLQLNFFEDIKSLDDLLKQKNSIFVKALSNVQYFKSRRSTIRHKLLYEGADSFLYKFAANRSITRETEEFTEEELSNWPSVYVFIWNAPNKQIIAVQERWNAFQQTEIVVKSIIDAVDSYLGEYNLRARFESIFSEHVFWDVIEGNKGKIKDIKFELITPNLANISDVLSEELKDFARGTNTAQTNLDIIADPASSIIIDKDNPKIKGLVQYSSQGGGNISIKLRGVSKRMHTKKSKKRFEIDEVEISGKNDQQFVNLLKGLFDNANL
jgi:hypothetical protein